MHNGHLSAELAGVFSIKHKLFEIFLLAPKAAQPKKI